MVKLTRCKIPAVPVEIKNTFDLNIEPYKLFLMSQLKNSQRISYKATYVQVSPRAVKDGRNDPRKKLQRAVEKAAFVQSLRMVPEELQNLRRTATDRRQKKNAQGDAESTAFAAIEKLVNDKSTTSTLNNAALFAGIDYETLIDFSGSLLEHRKSVYESISTALAAAMDNYSKYLFTPSGAAPATSALTQADKGTTTDMKVEKAISASGLNVIRRTQSDTSKSQRGKGKNTILTSGQTVHVSIDRGAMLKHPGIHPAASVYKPSGDNAVAWAERNDAKTFGNLYSLVLPYLNLSDPEAQSMGKAKVLMDFMKKSSPVYFNHNTIVGLAGGFKSRMEIEPVGNLHLERIEMYPAGVERGELINSVPLAPNETVNISHKEWSVSEREFEEIVDDYFEGYSETGVADKTDIAMSNESQSKHTTALNIGASLSASYATVTLSTNFGYNATSDDEQSKKDSRNHSMSITKKASARTKKDHKTTFKVSSVAGSEDQSVRVITNPSDTDAMRIDYFQLARKWKVDLLRYGLRMTYDIVIPNPGSGLVTKVMDVKKLDDLINTSFSFSLPLSSVTVDNYDTLAAQFDANVSAPPENEKWVNAHKEIPRGDDDFYKTVHFDAVDFSIDEAFYIDSIGMSSNFEHDSGDSDSYLKALDNGSISDALTDLAGKSGNLSIDVEFQYIYSYAINITFHCVPKDQTIQNWRLQAWNQIRQGAEDQYNKSIQTYKDQRTQLIDEINGYDALTLRRMEQEEIMKGVLRWLFGPSFDLVPINISSLFGSDSSDPEVSDVLDPNLLSAAEWMNVMERGEFIKYIHNAIEWENVLYFTYPYFWDDNALWDFKKFLFHPDPTHRTFLRSGAARVVLTIRPGFEPSFTQLVETGAFNTLPGTHPYVTIAQEIQDFANTNYPGFPPANPEQDARPLIYLEQRRVWKEMQYIIQLLNAFKADAANNGLFPSTAQGLAVLLPYLAAVNTANQNANAQQLAMDPTTPLEALLPANYAAVPLNDFWGNPYFYKSPGDTGDFDLISFGADGTAGGTDKNADISANSEASLVSTWFEYTPTAAIDIAITMNKAGVTPPPISADIA